MFTACCLGLRYRADQCSAPSGSPAWASSTQGCRNILCQKFEEGTGLNPVDGIYRKRDVANMNDAIVSGLLHILAGEGKVVLAS